MRRRQQWLSGNIFNVFCGRAEGEERDSGERWVLLVEEEASDKIVEVYLANVFPKHLE